MKMSLLTTTLLTIPLLLIGCQPESTPEPEPTPLPESSASTVHPNLELLLAYEEAFNNEDVEAMLALAHDDIEWISVGPGELSVETSGKDALAESMASYFASIDTRAEVADSFVNGRYVSFVERVRWTTASGEEKSQASSAIAEIVDGKIRRISYYPAQP